VLSGWQIESTTKWKASFAHAWADKRRTLMHADDLAGVDWVHSCAPSY
jgi:hypothetical protein